MRGNKQPEIVFAATMAVSPDTSTVQLYVHPLYYSDSGYWLACGYLERQDLAGLRLHAQGNLTVDRTFDRMPAYPNYAWDTLVGDLYGMEVQVKEHTITIREAERIIKILRRVQAGMARAQEKMGYVNNYPDFVLRVAGILGVKSWLKPEDWHAGRCITHSLGYGINDLRWRIKQMADPKIGASRVADYFNRGVPVTERED